MTIEQDVYLSTPGNMVEEGEGDEEVKGEEACYGVLSSEHHAVIFQLIAAAVSSIRLAQDDTSNIS